MKVMLQSGCKKNGRPEFHTNREDEGSGCAFSDFREFVIPLFCCAYAVVDVHRIGIEKDDDGSKELVSKRKSLSFWCSSYNDWRTDEDDAVAGRLLMKIVMVTNHKTVEDAEKIMEIKKREEVESIFW
ncbi:unnamed protein product [Vicia faba]|uniref:Uncharacterized protein n=1 Tax=Vicia faba TaxID=3906 RepID=A0AAV0Z7W5_VICFA|nr:unnamed protein product [Vicia faba]